MAGKNCSNCGRELVLGNDLEAYNEGSGLCDECLLKAENKVKSLEQFISQYPAWILMSAELCLSIRSQFTVLGERGCRHSLVIDLGLPEPEADEVIGILKDEYGIN